MHRRSGFTIVELLIVIIVIAILAAISLVAYNGIQQRARDSERAQDMASLQKVLELYFIDNGSFPYSEDIRNPSWITTNLPTTDQGIFINPQDTNSTNSIVGSGSTVPLHKYSYYSTTSANEVCSTANANKPCLRYVLTWKTEATPTTNKTIIVDKR